MSLAYTPDTVYRAAALLTLRQRQQAAADWFATHARPSQQEPAWAWTIWLLLAGRGFGKTRTIVEWAKRQAQQMPGSRGAIVAATAADARDILVEGESGFLATGTEITYEPSKRRITFANGSRASLFSADEPNRLRGPQFHWAICDELAAWRFLDDAYTNLMLGLRLGTNPRCVVATTPRPIKVIKAMLTDPTVAVTRGSTYENRANLAPQFFEQIVRRYEGTRIGLQEIEAQILEDNPAALWQRATLEAGRVKVAPELTRIVIAIDPAATSGNQSDETGIVVCGKGVDGHGYVLDDLSLRASPDGWARKAIQAYHAWKADRIVVEVNQGGEMVSYTLRTIEPNLPITTIHASRGKQVRAEPVAALFEQGKCHMVGNLPDLEEQLCSWVPGDASPDRLDALCYALTDLMLGYHDPAGLVDFADLERPPMPAWARNGDANGE